MFKNLLQKFQRRIVQTFAPKKSLPEAPIPVPPSLPKAESGKRDEVQEESALRKGRSLSDEPIVETGKKPVTPWDISQFEVPPVEGQMRFHDLQIPNRILHAVADLGFQYCTPIQAELIPKTLAGSDATGKAQTGTGKTAAFLITIYTHFLRKPLKARRRPGVPRALILAPTRELVLQIEKDARDLGKYTDVSVLSVFGGLGYEKQKRTLAEKVIDIIVATPGRLMDFQRQNLIRLYKTEILVIDEADRMLDMGFIPDVRQIVSTTPPKEKRQTLFFSATITPEVERLARQWTRDPVHVEIEPEHVAAESINQLIYIVTTEEKFPLLVNLILGQNLERVLVFANRRDQTARLAERLKQYGINCAYISGEVSQDKRIRTLEGFRTGAIRVLVGTDVAARGLHVEGISHVVNFTLPRDPEDYVHRIGRTGRAGAAGTSISFACEEDSFFIPAIEEFVGTPLPCVMPDASLLRLPPPPARKPVQGRQERSGPVKSPRGKREGPPRPRRPRPERRTV